MYKLFADVARSVLRDYKRDLDAITAKCKEVRAFVAGVRKDAKYVKRRFYYENYLWNHYRR